MSMVLETSLAMDQSKSPSEALVVHSTRLKKNVYYRRTFSQRIWFEFGLVLWSSDVLIHKLKRMFSL